jgi:hypothetical protein
LTFRSSRKRVLGARKSDEEGVALGVHLNTAVAREDLPQHPPVFGKGARVGVTELV